MKKLVALLLCGLLCLGAVNAFAAEHAPGDTVTVTVKVTGNPNKAVGYLIRVNADSAGLEFVSASKVDAMQEPDKNGGSFSGFDEAGIPEGSTVGKIVYKVKDSAEPGDYKITVSCTSAFDANDNDVSLSVSGSTTVTVVGEDECEHTWGDWKETTAATCEKDGVETRTCTACGETEEQPIKAKGHTPGDDAETVKPTCTEDGYTTGGKCTVCGEVLDKEVLPATGHKDDGGKETKAATCTEKGEKVYTCTVCSEVVKTEEIAALGHKDDGGKETKAATCTEKGEKVYTCTVCNEVVKTEEIAALGHKPGEWVIVKEATKEEDGLKEQYCTVCDELLNSQVIPHAQWYHMSVCSVGPRFRDEGDITDKWDMFTPVDLSNDGEQVFDLVAGNKHIIGKVTVSVADGQVTVSYKTINHVEMKSDFLTFFADLASVTTLDESQLTGYAFGEAVSIADQLGGDTKVLLYIHGNAVYRDDARGLEELAHKTKAYQQYIEELKAVMD